MRASELNVRPYLFDRIRSKPWLRVCLLVGLFWLCAPPPAVADETAESSVRIILLHPHGMDGTLREGLVYTSGELTAIGFEIETQSTSTPLDPLRAFPASLGILAFDYDGRHLSIRAWPPDDGPAVTQTVDPRRPGVGAEAVSVRAVESLRAVLMQWAERVDCSKRWCPKVLRRFIHTGHSAPEALITHEPIELATPEPRSSDLAFNVRLGPSVVFDSNASGIGGRGQAFLGQDWYHVGFRVGALVLPLEVRDTQDAGSAELGRYSAELQLQAEDAVVAGMHWFIQVGGGVALYPIRGVAQDGFAGRSEQRTSPVAALDLGLLLNATQAAALYVSAGISLATAPPRVLIAGREVATLDQPRFSVSLGLAAGTF